MNCLGHTFHTSTHIRFSFFTICCMHRKIAKMTLCSEDLVYSQAGGRARVNFKGYLWVGFFFDISLSQRFLCTICCADDIYTPSKMYVERRNPLRVDNPRASDYIFDALFVFSLLTSIFFKLNQLNCMHTAPIWPTYLEVSKRLSAHLFWKTKQCHQANTKNTLHVFVVFDPKSVEREKKFAF